MHFFIGFLLFFLPGVNVPIAPFFCDGVKTFLLETTANELVFGEFIGLLVKKAEL